MRENAGFCLIPQSFAKASAHDERESGHFQSFFPSSPTETFGENWMVQGGERMEMLFVVLLSNYLSFNAMEKR